MCWQTRMGKPTRSVICVTRRRFANPAVTQCVGLNRNRQVRSGEFLSLSIFSKRLPPDTRIG